MFFKKSVLVLTLILFSFKLFATEKNQITTQLINLNSLEFTFNQVINEKVEKGSCILEFPGKLKCNYFDAKKKNLLSTTEGWRLLKKDIIKHITIPYLNLHS